ncbi:unnamed protein product, partial [Ilex paraguariensis]
SFNRCFNRCCLSTATRSGAAVHCFDRCCFDQCCSPLLHDRSVLLSTATRPIWCCSPLLVSIATRSVLFSSATLQGFEFSLLLHHCCCWTEGLEGWTVE